MRVALTLLFALVLTGTAQTTDVLETSTLPRLATAELEAGEVDAADFDARRLLALAAANSKEWNHDDLTHAAYTVLGRVALERGDLKTAKARLLESARINGSAALESFGPDLKLARELLAAGERDVVLQYLELCRGFWKYDRGRIDQFAELVKSEAGAGAKAPGFSLKDLHGRMWTLGEFSGRVVILNFWASWCLQCRDELPKLEKLADDSVVLAVNVGEDEATVRRLVEKNPISVPVLLAGDDAMILSYKVAAYPTQVVIDAKGQIAAYRVGIVTREVGQSEQGAK
jgi:thiol-disulfide isomerase/thioredoxin